MIIFFSFGYTSNGDYMKNKSIWINKKVNNERLPKLDRDIECDVLIIGGGIAGLSIAYHMMNSDKNVVLIEKDKCGMGATSKNTGKLTWMQDLIYSRLTNNYNSEVAKVYYDSQIQAIGLVKKIIKDNKIDIKGKNINESINNSFFNQILKDIKAAGFINEAEQNYALGADQLYIYYIYSALRCFLRRMYIYTMYDIANNTKGKILPTGTQLTVIHWSSPVSESIQPRLRLPPLACALL